MAVLLKRKNSAPASPSVAPADSEDRSAAGRVRNPRTERHTESGGVVQLALSAAPAVDPELAEYRGYLKIDQSKLDLALLMQASTYEEIGKRYSMAMSRRDKAKDDLAKYDSAQAQQVRAKLMKVAAETKGGKAPTEGQINDEVILLPGRTPFYEAHMNAAFLCSQWSNLKDAFEQRMRALHELVSLHSTGWYNNRTMTGGDVTSHGADHVREEQSRMRRGA